MSGNITKESGKRFRATTFWSDQETVFLNCPYEVFAGQRDAFQGFSRLVFFLPNDDVVVVVFGVGRPVAFLPE